jgi:hypothetical protein
VPTVGQFVHRWLEETFAPNLAPLTSATYESHVRNYIEPGIGSLRLDRLQVTDVQAWLNCLATQCRCCAQGKDAHRALHLKARCCAEGKCCHQVASSCTIKDIRTVLRSGLNSAVCQELLDRNVAELVQIPKQRCALDERGGPALSRIRPLLIGSALRRVSPGSGCVDKAAAMSGMGSHASYASAFVSRAGPCLRGSPGCRRGGVLAHLAWWPQAAIVGAAGSIVLLLLTLTPWWLLALAIDIAIVVLSWRTLSR